MVDKSINNDAISSENLDGNLVSTENSTTLNDGNKNILNEDKYIPNPAENIVLPAEGDDSSNASEDLSNEDISTNNEDPTPTEDANTTGETDLTEEANSDKEALSTAENADSPEGENDKECLGSNIMIEENYYSYEDKDKEPSSKVTIYKNQETQTDDLLNDDELNRRGVFFESQRLNHHVIAQFPKGAKVEFWKNMKGFLKANPNVNMTVDTENGEVYLDGIISNGDSNGNTAFPVTLT
ncbi:MAG: hypothetical protein Q4B52_05055 [Tissierellia bacterium]|nr:hypothetical protein [Tissierellia bacterium]